MLDQRDWYTTGLDHIWLPYAQMKTAPAPLPVVRTQGTRIHLADGRELVDGIASWWTACHGYNHPHIRDAVQRQLEVMPHVMFGGIVHEQPLTLARRLSEMLPGDLDRVFFTDSGSVSVEVAMKMAVQYWLNVGEKQRDTFVCFRGGYHGDTLGTMAVSDFETGIHQKFGGILHRHHCVALPESPETDAALVALIGQHADRIAGIIVEPLVQGAGGMRFHCPKVLWRLREIADSYGALLILDEIFTGFGRTGTMFACEAAGIVPDIVTLSKALTGGTLPLAATVARRRIFESFWSDDPMAALMHGPTYMANALACAAANASLDLFEDGERLRHVGRIEQWLAAGLSSCRDLPGVVDVRTRGAIGVVELQRIDDLNALRSAFVEKAAFIRPLGNAIYLAPALTIGEEDVAFLTGVIGEVLRERR
ncbi:adenosylmethionine--8-amino-7-oxononanoate transaminase [Pseudorhodoplanes sp.]|uniref:adenosylmethionine--8-amino-7-oxononanoate transaminase n=1 Tax=Pseudorhodoplanes sp. TaxID=1934341 RepID=UPI00391BCE24